MADGEEVKLKKEDFIKLSIFSLSFLLCLIGYNLFSESKSRSHLPLSGNGVSIGKESMEAKKKSRIFYDNNPVPRSFNARNLSEKPENEKLNVFKEKKVERLYAFMPVKWSTKNIPVCWENPANYNSAERNWVREAIEGTWERYSAIKFINWDQCYPASRGIHILIHDSHPHTKGLGTDLDGQTNGMVLNFNFNNWKCSLSREQCIKIVSVHEFGHALGFNHEHNRDDRPPECTDEKQGMDRPHESIKLTEFDMKSVMNYCNPEWSGNGRLSTEDITGLQSWYGNSKTEAGFIEWEFTNNSTTDIYLEFYSMDRKEIWPGGYEVYRIRPKGTQTFNLQGEENEKVCYGAWTGSPNMEESYWGVGRGNRYGCTNCCGEANGGTIYKTSIMKNIENESFVWKFKNNSPNLVNLKVYSQDSKKTWPAGNQIYKIEEGEEISLSIAGQNKEKVCYGAWTGENTETSFWGVGKDDKHNCSECCKIIGNSEPSTTIFNGDKVSPGVVWKIRNNFPYSVYLKFYSQDRNNAWPSASQVYVLDDSRVHEFKLSGYYNEKICYGAWTQSGEFWGVGINNSYGCSNCCSFVNNNVIGIVNLNF